GSTILLAPPALSGILLITTQWWNHRESTKDKPMRRVLRLSLCLGALLVTAGLIALPGCGGNKEKRIVILTNGESPFWDAARQGLEKASEDFELSKAGYKATLDVNDGTEAGQLDRLRDYASQSDIVAIGVSVTKEDNAAIADQLRELKKKGIHIITIDSDVS